MRVSVKKIKVYPNSEKYFDEILRGHIELENIPIYVLRGDQAKTIFVAIFRADRGKTKERFWADLNFLKVECHLAKIANNQSRSAELERLYDTYESEFRWRFSQENLPAQD